jgi:hypothetical protein
MGLARTGGAALEGRDLFTMPKASAWIAMEKMTKEEQEIERLKRLIEDQDKHYMVEIHGPERLYHQYQTDEDPRDTIKRLLTRLEAAERLSPYVEWALSGLPWSIPEMLKHGRCWDHRLQDTPDTSCRYCEAVVALKAYRATQDGGET